MSALRFGLTLFAFTAASLVSSRLAPIAKVYVDPLGAYSLSIPDKWTAEREEVDEGTYLTSIGGEEVEDGAIDILSIPSAEDLNPSQTAAAADAIFPFVKQEIAQMGKILSEKRSETTFDGRKAIRFDVRFQETGGPIFSGYLVILMGKRNIIMARVWSAESKKAAFAEAEAHFNTLAIESRTPRGMGGKPASIAGTFNKGTITGAIKSAFRRDSMDKVLVAGDPALTYGSVANFVTVVEILFDIQFTETEFDATRQRFIEYYGKADAEGKKVLAVGGADLLKTLTTGTPAEIEQSRKEGREVFTNSFRAGAAAGIEYAVVMWAAIERRAEQTGKTSQAKPTDKPAQAGWDTDVSQGDLDATLEMLYFMWVASGRSADDVTEEDVIRIRQSIIAEFATFDPEVQLIIANAQKVYAALRQQWAAASPAQRQQLAVAFGQALDSLGLKEGGSFESTSGGGGGSDLAAIAQNTAWNAAKTWSTTSGG